MSPPTRLSALQRLIAAAGLAAALAFVASAAFAASASEITSNGRAALQRLYASSSGAQALGGKASAVLVFPEIVKAGLMIGGLGGEGVMLVKGKPVGYYRIAAATYGLQAGAQKYSYALFFMTPSSVNYLSQSKGWSIGSGPSVVVMDEGKAKAMNSTTMTQDVYAFPFGQKGLMAGMGLEGSKITPIQPK